MAYTAIHAFSLGGGYGNRLDLTTNQNEMKTTQKQRLKKHLDSGQSINRLSALLDLGIFELASRIGELEKDTYPIDKDRTTITNRFGEKVSVMVYSKKTNDAN